jgi:hypothetical protein
MHYDHGKVRPLQQLQQLHPTSSKGLMLVFLKHSLLDIAVAVVVLCHNTDGEGVLTIYHEMSRFDDAHVLTWSSMVS